jgi:hypothetical protein
MGPAGDNSAVIQRFDSKVALWAYWGRQAYSKNLRIRVIDAGRSRRPPFEVAEQFMVSLRTIKR